MYARFYQTYLLISIWERKLMRHRVHVKDKFCDMFVPLLSAPTHARACALTLLCRSTIYTPA